MLQKESTVLQSFSIHCSFDFLSLAERSSIVMWSSGAVLVLSLCYIGHLDCNTRTFKFLLNFFASNLWSSGRLFTPCGGYSLDIYPFFRFSFPANSRDSSAWEFPTDQHFLKYSVLLVWQQPSSCILSHLNHLFLQCVAWFEFQVV